MFPNHIYVSYDYDVANYLKKRDSVTNETKQTLFI